MHACMRSHEMVKVTMLADDDPDLDVDIDLDPDLLLVMQDANETKQRANKTQNTSDLADMSADA